MLDMPECGYYKDWYDVWKAGLSGISPAGCGHLSGGGFATVLCGVPGGCGGLGKTRKMGSWGVKERRQESATSLRSGGVASDTVTPKRELGWFSVTQWYSSMAVTQ